MMSDDRIERDKTLKDMFRKYLRVKSNAKDVKSPTGSAAPAPPPGKSPPPKSPVTPTTASASSSSITSKGAPTSEKSCRTEDEDAEVFENEIGSRPAVTRMRCAKIKWKSDEKKSSSKDSEDAANRVVRRKKRSKTPVTADKDSRGKEKTKEAISDKSKDKEHKKDKPAAVEAKKPPKELKKSKTEKQDKEAASKMETKEPASKMEKAVAKQDVKQEPKLDKETKEPASKMEKKIEPKELEAKLETKVEKEPKEPASKMEKAVPKQDVNKDKQDVKPEPKVDKEPPSNMEKLEPKQPAEPPAEESPKSEMESEKKESVDPELMLTAASILDCLKRNQLLESALNYQETATMTSFFENSGATPSAQVVSILDKAMTSALNKLEFKPDELDVTIDNRMRELLLNRDKAKTVLLEVLLSRSTDFLPISWGGRGGDRTVENTVEIPKTPPFTSSKSPAASTPENK